MIRLTLALLLLLGACGCSGNYTSAIPGRYWHRVLGGERYLVETKTGHVEYWMFSNLAGSCSAQSMLHASEFTEDFVDCDAAVKAIEAREIEIPPHDPTIEVPPSPAPPPGTIVNGECWEGSYTANYEQICHNGKWVRPRWGSFSK